MAIGCNVLGKSQRGRVMSEKSKNAKAEKKQTNVKIDSSKISNPQTETSSNVGENKSQDKNSNSGEMAKKDISPKSASQTSISHFSSVSTPEYRAGWDKIFGKSELEQSHPEKTKHDQRAALVSEEWRNYKETKDPKHLAIVCRELPFFGHPEVGEEIAKLLLKQ